MADGRKNNNPVKKIKPGSSGNLKGSPDKIRVMKSKLRDLLEDLSEAKLISAKNMKDSVNGKEVNAEVLSSSKWIVQTIIALEKAILSEELSRTKLRIEMLELRDDKSPQSLDEVEKEAKPRLVLVYKEPTEEDEE